MLLDDLAGAPSFDAAAHLGAATRTILVEGVDTTYAVEARWRRRPPPRWELARVTRRASRLATRLAVSLSVMDQPVEVVPVVVYWGSWRRQRSDVTRMHGTRVMHVADAVDWFDMALASPA